MGKCVFCEIAAKRLDPDLTVYEDDDVLAQVSLLQKASNRGHVIVVPRRHVPDLYDLPDDLGAPLMSALRLLARATKRAFAADGIQVRQNNDPAAGQDVFHLHFHVVPRYEGDGFGAAAYAKVPREERLRQAGALREVLRESR